MLPQDLNTIIGEYLYLFEIKILSKIFNTNEWNVYDSCFDDHKYNFNFLNLKYDLGPNIIPKNIPKDLYEVQLNSCFIQYYINYFNNLHALNIYFSYNHVFGSFLKDLSKDLHTLTFYSDYYNVYISGNFIKDLPRYLYKLNISGFPITDSGIDDSTFPKGLRMLNINHCRISDKIIKYLPRGLRVLDLSQNIVTDLSIKDLPRFLRILNICCNFNITNNCIKDLPKNIIELYTYQTGITCNYVTGFNYSVNYKELCNDVVNKQQYHH
jgi:hypothetical protein